MSTSSTSPPLLVVEEKDNTWSPGETLLHSKDLRKDSLVEEDTIGSFVERGNGLSDWQYSVKRSRNTVGHNVEDEGALRTGRSSPFTLFTTGTSMHRTERHIEDPLSRKRFPGVTHCPENKWFYYVSRKREIQVLKVRRKDHKKKVNVNLNSLT